MADKYVFIQNSNMKNLTSDGVDYAAIGVKVPTKELIDTVVASITASELSALTAKLTNGEPSTEASN